MSGGHFDYQDYHFNYVIEKLDDDIKYNNVAFTPSNGYDQKYGHNLSEEALGYVRRMLSDLQNLKNLLHSYDYAVSGDTSIDEFLEDAKKHYEEVV